MPFRDPLTHDQLREIRERQPWNPDVIALLWEVKRLRSLALRFYQLQQGSHRPAGLLENCWDDVAQRLANEPCVQERNRNVNELLNPDPPSKRNARPPE